MPATDKSTYSDWRKMGYVEQFDATNGLSTDFLAIEWLRKHPLPLIDDILSGETEVATMLEIGFATGEFYRYVRQQLPMVEYTGADISEAAFEMAKNRYSDARFLLTDVVKPDFVDGNKYDFVFSRDVVHHTGAPYAALQNLYDATKQTLAVSLRTRDEGDTVVDIERSYQEIYGTRYHYSMLNLEELIEFFRTQERKPARITVLREHLNLAGQEGRVIPNSDRSSTGSAVTSIRVDIDPAQDTKEPVLSISDWTTPPLGLKYRLLRVARRFSRGLAPGS
jgi:SAM-dependent methyltransferase